MPTTAPQKFELPTSGQVLRLVVRAFSLQEETVGGASGVLLANRNDLGEANPGRTASRFFVGKPVPDLTKVEIIRHVASALVNSGLLEGVCLPPWPDTQSPKLEDLVGDAIFAWGETWDAAIRQGVAGWPDPPPRLGAYVVGRQVVIDLGLRVAAAVCLMGRNMPDTLWLPAAEPTPGGALLNHVLEQHGFNPSPTELARLSGVDERNTARWLRENVQPAAEHLIAITERLSPDAATRARALRLLRVQYGVLRLIDSTATAMPREASMDLAHALLWFSSTCGCLNALRSAPDKLGLDGRSFELAMMTLMLKGSAHELMPELVKYFPVDMLDELWKHELRLTAAMPMTHRIFVAFRTIGDAAGFARANKMDGMSSQESIGPLGLTRLESLGLFSMCPVAMDSLGRQARSANGTVVRDVEEQRLWDRAQGLMQTGRYKECVQVLEQLVARIPNDAALRCHVGEMQLQLKMNDAAASSYAASIELEPAWDEPFVGAGRVLRARGLLDAAIHHLQGGIQRYPRSVSLFSDLGFSLLTARRYAEALDCLERAIELEPSYANVLAGASRCLYFMPQSRSNRERGQRYARLARLHGASDAADLWKLK